MPEVMEDALKRILESCKWDAVSAAGCIRRLQPLCNRRPSLMDRYGTSEASALHAHRAQQGARHRISFASGPLTSSLADLLRPTLKFIHVLASCVSD